MRGKKEQPPAAERTPQERRDDPMSERRRTFLGRLLAAGSVGAAALVAGVGLGRPRKGPRERELHEADFYRPHDLAG